MLKEWVVGGGRFHRHFWKEGSLAGVLKYFTDDAMTISAGSLFHNWAAGMTPVGGTSRRGRITLFGLGG